MRVKGVQTSLGVKAEVLTFDEWRRKKEVGTMMGGGTTGQSNFNKGKGTWGLKGLKGGVYTTLITEFSSFITLFLSFENSMLLKLKSDYHHE